MWLLGAIITETITLNNAQESLARKKAGRLSFVRLCAFSQMTHGHYRDFSLDFKKKRRYREIKIAFPPL